MKKTVVKIVNCILVFVLVFSLTIWPEATTIGQLEQNIADDNNSLSELNDIIMGLEDEQDLLDEQISDLDAELVNMMTEIGILEEEIADKTEEIAVVQGQYDEAKAREEEQYNAMVRQIQFMYERGDTDYLTALLGAGSFDEVLNQITYMEAVYDYDRKLLEEYEDTKVQVGLLWDQLEADKAELQEAKAGMEVQQAYLDEMLEKLKIQSANYDAQLARARQEASLLKAKIKQEQAELKKLQEEERRKAAAAAAASGNYTVNKSVSEIISGASGSDLGKKIALYACQYIGNPYVAGGTSLTKGADCSGFTYRVFMDFGYTIPRTSYSQRSAGVEVSYKDAQPGDIICYDGHVALYIGGGYIVHASTAKTGIKLGRAEYRTILSVRRII
ncbi:MAG: C40 family peptidase [Lachnospiraceae bacterium]|nr:C40 family peptidase [Lachnospiraceae bacterium]